MVDFASILEKPSGQNNAPASLPPGIYLAVCVNGELKERPTKNNPEGAPVWEAQFSIREPLDGVDQDELTERGIDFSKKKVKHLFWLMENSLWVLDDDKSGVFVKAGLVKTGKSLGDLLQEMLGMGLKVQITEQLTQDGERTWNGISKFFSVDG